MKNFYIYLLIMAGITYLIRMVPLVIFKKKIKSRFVLSFLYYVPYAVLTVMTVPQIFTSTSSWISALLGFLVAIILSLMEKSLLTVAASSCLTVFLVEMLIKMI